MSAHSEFHFSITCHTDDKATMYCLRSLAHFAEHHGQKNIAWGGTNDDAWERADHTITLRFSKAHYRQVFRDTANDLLPGRWKETKFDDNDPATPKQR